MMKRRLMAVMSAAAVMAAALTGCGSQSQGGGQGGNGGAANVPTEPFGDTIKYDPAVAINDGKDISIELWEWGRKDIYHKRV